MGVCSVLGCQSRFNSEGKHLFKFPKENSTNSKIVKCWIKFAKKNVNTKSSFICEDHFSSSCFVTKNKGRLCLVKDSVPTIYTRILDSKIERFEISYDILAQEYIDDEIFIQNLDERENQLLNLRDRKVLELKFLCRFCFGKDNEKKCVAIKKLETYSINPVDIMMMLDVGVTQYTEILSELICEKCFNTLVQFDNFKKQCKRLQNDFIQEIQEIDQKLKELKNCQRNQQENLSWFKIELINDKIINEEINENSYDPIEERLDEEDTYEENYVDVIDQFQNEIDEANNFKEEKDDDDNIFKVKDKYDVVNKEAVIKNPDRNSVAYRIYECFFCRLKFAARKIYNAHVCSAKEIKCQLEGCSKVFTKKSGYMQHIVKVHNHLRVLKHFCPLCKQVIVASETQFKKHCKHCNKELSSKEQIIECEVCKKKCKNLKSYTVHKMFHDSRNLAKIQSNDGNGPKNQPLATVICELCGRSFSNAQGLRTHKKNVHLIGSNGEIYQCDICSKKKPTKRSLFNHMRNVHRVQETPCTVCGKVFRTKALLQKHSMYHDETKRIHFCTYCPDRPAYFTNVALRRHQKSHHIGLKEFICNFENCDSSYTSNHMLKMHHRQHHGAQ